MMRNAIRHGRMLAQGLLLLHLLWWCAAEILRLPVLPGPAVVYRSFGRVLESGILLHIGYSLWRIGAGLLLSLAVGVPLGILTAYSKRWSGLLYPLVYLCYPIPKTALLPVAMLLLGMRDGSKIAIMVLIMVFQILVSVHDSVRAIDPVYEHTVISAGGGCLQILLHVTLPAMLPALLSAVRVSVGTAVSVLFFVEGYGTRHGMGYYILDAWSRLNYVEMYGGIAVISLVGFLLFAGIDALAAALRHESFAAMQDEAAISRHTLSTTARVRLLRRGKTG